ncbi:hypothetical protein JTB14_033918 [Gonioctena quinquepunctata]|nr:hypothetical protein JTB14_033918 [Gonioctena quinquepunctata]
MVQNDYDGETDGQESEVEHPSANKERKRFGDLNVTAINGTNRTRNTITFSKRPGYVKFLMVVGPNNIFVFHRKQKIQNTVQAIVSSAEANPKSIRNFSEEKSHETLEDQAKSDVVDLEVPAASQKKSDLSQQTEKADSKSGIGGEGVEEPSLWYYSLLLFTADHEEPRDTISNEGSDDNGETEEASRNPTPKKKANKSVTSTSARTLDENKEKLLKKAYEALSNDDEYVAVTVAAKLRKLSEEQLLYCENIINKVLFKAALNKLSENTTLVTSPSYEKKAPRQSSSTFNINSIINREETPSTQNCSFITLSSAIARQATCTNYQEHRPNVYRDNVPPHPDGSITSEDTNPETNSIFTSTNVKNYFNQFNQNG